MSATTDGPHGDPDTGVPRTDPARRTSARRALGAAGGVVAAGMAVLWTVVVPGRAEHVTGLQEVAIRVGHPACWALLAVTGLLVAVDAPRRLRDASAYAAVIAYAVFLVALLA